MNKKMNINFIIKKQIINLIHIKIKIVNFKKRILCENIFKDMLYYIHIWRQIKGYPKNGQNTHRNAKNSRKNKLILQYRIQQFYKMFGKKRRDIFPTLIQAEYMNRLWKLMWYKEWLEAGLFLIKIANPKNKMSKFDPVMLAKGLVTGFKRVGAASKIGKSKKAIKIGTIGVPVLFSRYLYDYKKKQKIPYILQIPDDTRKKMGKKKKKH